MDITDIGHKVENGGVSAQGKLSAEEFNTVLDKVVELMTLGGHDDMLAGVDGTATDDVALVKRAGTDKWAVMKLSDILGGVDVSMKFGDADYADGTISFYDEPGGTVLQTVTLSGTIYNINIATNVAQVFSVLTGDEHKIITITPSTTAGSLGETPEDFPESYSYVVSVDTGSGYVPRFSGTIPVGGTGSFDIRSALVVGTNRIRISVTGDQSQTTKTRILTATLTNLALSCSHAWQTPWMEGSDYTIGNIYFQGNIPKTLHIVVNGNEYTRDYRANESYPSIPTTYVLYAADFPELEASGVVEVEMWMTGESVTTPHIFMNIMCVQEGDTTPLVCINEVADSAVNFSQGTLFKYAVYGASLVEIATTVQANGTFVLPSQTSSVVPGQQYSFSTALDVETEATDGTLTSVLTPYQGSTEGTEGTVTMPLDNSHAFLPIPGAVFMMNAAIRSNTESDRLVWKNTAQGAQISSYPTVMTGFTFNTDAWATDQDGHKAFVVPARCLCEVPLLKPFAASGGMMGTTGVTVEMLIRCSNIADHDTPVLSIMDQNGTLGLKVYPTKVVMLGSTETSEVLQGVGLCEDVMTHVAVVLQRNYAGQTGYNLCSIYINGIPNVSFSFGSTSLFGNGSLLIGQDAADFYLYSMRIHDKALDGQGIKADMLNAIIDGVILDREETREKDDIIMGSAIEYQLVKNLGYNIMIVDPNDDQIDIPSFDNQITAEGCTVRFEYGDHPEWNVQIDNVPIDGQGTTSKKYFRWNLRGKLADDSVWTYADGTTSTGKKGFMDGGPTGAAGHLKIDRFTAKKNVASMPQGHKMGATALYDDLFTELGLKSELPDSRLRVAVWQYPFFGFRRYSNGAYEFIGLYTAGPDKGCKTTFGYDKTAYPAAMCIEGPNHDPRGTRFLHPWVNVTYDYNDETLKFGGEEGWDCDYCKFGTDKASDQASILALYTSEWKPAYDLVYHCSPYIESLAAALTAGGYADVAALNADIDVFKASSTNGVSNLLLSFYDTNYDIWYLSNTTGLFEKLVREDGDESDGLWNIKTYLGLTGSPTTAEIKAARTAKFKAELSDYFSVDQTLYHKAFCLLIGAKDNDAKNTYPYKHLALSDSGAGNRWGWKQDDLDSIFDVDNNGQSTVQYWIEPGDKANSVEIFQGCDSAFWYHIWIAYQSELKSMFESFETALVAIGNRLGILGNHSYETAYNVLAHYFFGNSAKYFPMTAYQEDRIWAYITPWLLDPTKVYNNVYPLTQAIGDRYLGERYWIERRIMYLWSKYRLGAFTGSASGWNAMAFTIARDVVFTFNVVPALAHYPCANLGGGTDIQGARTFPGNSTPLTLTSSGATTLYIKSTDWLEYLGDLSGLELTSRGGGDSIPFAIVSDRMRRVKVGDAVAENVVFNATDLSISGPCIEDIDARNVLSLTGMVDLSRCPRLRKALFGGCPNCSIMLPAGSRVNEVSFPDSMTTLFLHSLVYLTDGNLSIPSSALSTISSFYFENCPNINPLEILDDILGEDPNSLAYVTIILNGTVDATGAQVQALYELAVGDYGRLVYEDGTVSPSIVRGALVQGTIHTAGMFSRQYDAIHAAFPDLTIIADKVYVEFEDQEVWRICCTNWGDYDEVVTTIDSNAGTTTIVTTPVSMLNTTATRGTPTTVTRVSREGDTAGTVKVPVGITQAQCAAVSSLGTAFRNVGVTRFNELADFTSLQSTVSYVFEGSQIESIIFPEGFENLNAYTFANSAVQKVILPTTTLTIGTRCFFNGSCAIMILLATSPPTLNLGSYSPTPGSVYVPDDSVEDYKAATNWSSIASKIYPLSEFTG